MVGGNDSPQPLTTENLWNLSQDKLKEIIKQVSKVRETKYQRRKTRKYGNLKSNKFVITPGADLSPIRAKYLEERLNRLSN